MQVVQQQPRRAADVDTETAAIMDTIVQTRRERDMLRDEVERLEAGLATARREGGFLREQLQHAEFKRDFYQRHYVSLHVRLADIGNTIMRAIEDAKIEAAANGIDDAGKRSEVAADLDDEARLRDLASKLSPENAP